MIKKIGIGISFVIVLTAICIVFSSCSMFQEDYSNNHMTILDMENHFVKSGVKIESIQPAVAQVCRADRALILKIAGKDIGIYKYDINKKVQMEKLDNISKNGYIYVMAIKYPVMVNGSFMMLGYHKNPEKAKIVEAFKSFKLNDQ